MNALRHIITHGLNYKYWSIRFKLLTMSALFILGSVFLVSFLSYLQYTKNFEQQSSEKVQQIIEQASLNIDTYLDDLFRLSLYPYHNEQLMNALDEDEHTTELRELEKTWMIEDFLEEIMIFPRKDILRVFIMKGDSIYSSGRVQTTINPEVQLNQFDWYKKALTTQESIFVPAHLEQLVKDPKYRVFSIVKQLRSIRDTDKILGVIKVDANYSGIEAIGNRLHMGEEGGLFIIDGSQNIIYSNIPHQEPNKFESIIDQFSSSNQGTGSTLTVQDDKYLLNSTHIPRSNWTIIAVNSVQELNQEALNTRNIAFLMAVLCSFLAIAVLFFFIRRFLKPILKIVRLMKDINLGNLSVSFPDKRHDEIGYLGSSFNEMVGKINSMLEENTKLVEEVYEAKFAQKEAQINVLFNQIKPHFLFNTLNMVSLLMQSGKEEKAIDHINKLSHIMRNITNWQKEVTLKDELELLRSYLSIQCGRFEGRLDYIIDIDPSLESYPIPAFLLQPIVENAVIYGCELKKEKTTIRISQKKDGDDCILEVSDNGIGMDTETLKALQNKLEARLELEDTHIQHHQKGLGIGLVNVNKRIKLKYGTNYGLTIESQHNIGTKVSIKLPRMNQEGLGKDHV
jgi:two-component system sensor histidine kinase YesM